MTVQEKRANFKSQMMDSSRMKVLCGAFDGITARAAQAADFFDGCYMGGQAAAASLLGVPDLGLVCGCEPVSYTHLFPGGYYHPEDYNFTSPEAVDFIRRHRANKSFISVSGIHRSLGITCINAHIVDSKRALIDSSAQNIMLADSSKFDLVKANHFAELHDMDMLITDNKLSLDWRDFLNNAQINLKLV